MQRYAICAVAWNQKLAPVLRASRFRCGSVYAESKHRMEHGLSLEPRKWKFGIGNRANKVPGRSRTSKICCCCSHCQPVPADENSLQIVCMRKQQSSVGKTDLMTQTQDQVSNKQCNVAVRKFDRLHTRHLKLKNNTVWLSFLKK